MSHELRIYKNRIRKVRRMLKLHFKQRHLMIRQLRKGKQGIQPRPVPKTEPLKELLEHDTFNYWHNFG